MTSAFFLGVLIGIAIAALVFVIVQLFVHLIKTRRERKRGYAIDVYEPEPLTPAKH